MMKNGKYTKRRGVATKVLVMTLALMLVVGLSVGGTLAWLTAKTNSVVNTFTVGNIDITLGETKSDFKMVPGATIAKDPVATVLAGSEDCYLFVKIEESENLDNFITYTVAEGWTELQTGVYYREVGAKAADQAFSVLANDQVTVKTDVTKDMMDAIENQQATNPTLTFTAYAIQKEGFATAAAAWAEVSK